MKINFYKKMNFFLCNRCKKRSDDNILNLYNNTEKLPNKRTHNFSNVTNVDNNMINQVDTSEKLQPMDYLKNNYEINMNIKDLEEDDDDEDDLQIIEYPYQQLEKNKKSNINDKLKNKEFKNNQSKFTDDYLIEKNVINKLNYMSKISNNKNGKNIKNDVKQNSDKNKIIEKKDTLIEPSNLALSSLIQDINKKSFKKNKINTERKEEKSGQTSIQNLKHFIASKNNNKDKNIIKASNNLIKNNKNIKKIKKSEYSNNIINKKRILKNKIISNKNIYINSLSISNLIINSKNNNFTKSYSFNNFQSSKNNLTKIRNNNINNNNLTYSLIFKNSNKIINNGIFSAKNNIKSKSKIK